MPKLRCSCLPYLATPLVAIAVLGFSGCSSDGNANMAPVEGEAPDPPEIEAIKKSGKSPQEIRRLLLEQVKAKQTTSPAKPQGRRGRTP